MRQPKSRHEMNTFTVSYERLLESSFLVVVVKKQKQIILIPIYQKIYSTEMKPMCLFFEAPPIFPSLLGDLLIICCSYS